jgi:hypothetical protein
VTSPVLRTDLRPDSDSEQVMCSEEEREMVIQGDLLAREADTTLRPNDVNETHEETPSVVYIDARFLRGFKSTTMKSNQDLDSGGVESKDTTQDDVPIALRTRSREQLQHLTECMKNQDLIDKSDIEAELKELLKQLIIQNKNQQDEIKAINSTLKSVLELQITSIQDVQRSIVAVLQNDYQEKFDNISIPSSISDPTTLGNRFMPVTDTKEFDVIHGTSSIQSEPISLASPPKPQDRCRNRHLDGQSRKDFSTADEVTKVESGVYMKGNCIDTGGNIRKMLPTGPLDDSAIDHAKAFMVTPKKNRSRSRRLVDIAIDAMEGTDDDVAIDHAKAFMTTPRKNNPEDTMDYDSNTSNVENSEMDGSTISASDAGHETEASDECLNRSKDISELSSTEDSENDLKSSKTVCRDQTRRMQSKSQESHRRSHKKKGCFVVPKEPKKVRDEARERLDNALNQVSDAVHFDQKGKRTTKTLYVGNLDYNSNAEPLHKALLQALKTDFRKRIRLEKTDLPENDGKSRGYGFVTLSWAEAADVNPSDICTIYSGMIDASSRFIYLQQLRKENLQTGYLGRRGSASIARM